MRLIAKNNILCVSGRFRILMMSLSKWIYRLHAAPAGHKLIIRMACLNTGGTDGYGKQRAETGLTALGGVDDTAIWAPSLAKVEKRRQEIQTKARKLVARTMMTNRLGRLPRNQSQSRPRNNDLDKDNCTLKMNDERFNQIDMRANQVRTNVYSKNTC